MNVSKILPKHLLETCVEPVELRLTDERTVLAVVWPDGTSKRLSANFLRRSSRAASAVRARVDGIDSAGIRERADLRVVGIESIGNYALRLTFSDGHDRGIYPWTYLRELCGPAA